MDCFLQGIQQLRSCGDEPYDNESVEEVYGKGSLKETLNEIEEILLVAFGDHVEVSATRGEITVDEYSHD